jgi:hypothetical protein
VVKLVFSEIGWIIEKLRNEEKGTVQRTGIVLKVLGKEKKEQRQVEEMMDVEYGDVIGQTWDALESVVFVVSFEIGGIRLGFYRIGIYYIRII